jgi:hypothetical protein
MMDEPDRKQLYNTAWKHWGSQAQMDMLIEEMAKLTQAILKTRRNGVTFSCAVSEEMADVLICLEQIETRLKGMPSSGGETWWTPVERIKEEKLARLQSRLFDSLKKKYPGAGPQDGRR